MNRHDAKDIRLGDKLKPIPLWNVTQRTRKLPETITVTDIREASGSQSGVLFRVDFQDGSDGWLDAGWFEIV